MSYEQDLVFYLRQEGFSEERITSVLREVREVVEISGTPARDAFGPAEEYAERLHAAAPPESAVAAPGARAFRVAVYIALALNVVNLALRVVGNELVTPLYLVLLSGGVCIIVAAAAIFADRRLPKSGD